MNPSRPLHPLLYTYLKQYQEDPTSRIFAPLAEAYRKAGLISEAIEIAKEGLKIHPYFAGGRVALARALFDQQNYAAVTQELASLAHDVPDNLLAQKLLAESYLMQGRMAESLNAYKMLLYFSPQDLEVSKIVQELESQAYQKGDLTLRTDSPLLPLSFQIQSAKTALNANPENQRIKSIQKIERLQSFLQTIERYRAECARL